MAESSEKMPPYPDIFTDDFQMSDQVKYDIFHMTYDKLEVHSIIVLFLFKQEYWGFKFIPSPFLKRVSCFQCFVFQFTS